MSSALVSAFAAASWGVCAAATALPPIDESPVTVDSKTTSPLVQSIRIRFDENDRQVIHLPAQPGQTTAEGDWVVLRSATSIEPTGIAVVTGRAEDHAIAALRWADDLGAAESDALLIPATFSLDSIDAPLRLRAIQSRTNAASTSLESPDAAGVCTVTHVAQDGGFVKMRWTAANPASRLGVGDRFDLFDARDYIAFGRVVAMDQTGAIEAEIMSAMSRRSPAPGDVALRRQPPSQGDALRGFVFRYERGFALISLGEADGMGVGDRLFGRLIDGADAVWIVDRVYPDHCSVAASDPIQSAPEAVIWSPASTKPGLAVLAIAESDAWRAVEAAPLAMVKKTGLDQPTRPYDYVMRSGSFENVGIVLIDGPDAVLVRTIERKPAAETAADPNGGGNTDDAQ